MINEVSSAGKADHKEQIDNSKKVTELSEDMEMVSPGAMLREARKALALSQDHIANKLNLKITLVQNIENDIFDPSMPVTFNRGYLSNYAKLVGVDIEDVLASYDALDAASIQRSEMLSFSKETLKQAEHSRVMWLSYLIVAVLIGLTVLWWQQESSQKNAATDTAQLPQVSQTDSGEGEIELNEVKTGIVTATPTPTPTSAEVGLSVTEESIEEANSTAQLADNSVPTPATLATPVQEVNELAADIEAPIPDLSTAVFTFEGDCWVNIFDATGERIAWGVKKAGYVMTIQGKAPLKVTVGKPELTSIVFNDQTVDMSAFNIGNIAKFELPLNAE